MIQIIDNLKSNSSDKLRLFRLASCWIVTFGYFNFVSGEIKPHCNGEPLNPAEFSSKGDVAYVRDLCVDVVARNVNNILHLQGSVLCDELANMKTSTCFTKNICLKWKRVCFWNASATKRVTSKAEEVIQELDDIVSKDVVIDDIEDEKFLFEQVEFAKKRLIKSKIASKDSFIIEKLQSMKKYCCSPFQLGQYQKEYQESIQDNSALIMKRIDELVNNVDVRLAIKIFIKNFEAKYEVKITKFYFENPITSSGKAILENLASLSFECKKGTETKSSAAFMKFPSLYPLDDEVLTRIMFEREAHYYATLLPALYRLGNCKPFSAKAYAVTETNAFVMEDLLLQGYDPGDAVEQLDLDEIKISLLTLAEYHALGYKYIRTLSDDDPRMLFIKSHPPIVTENDKKEAFDIFTEMLESSLSDQSFQRIVKKENEILAEPRTLKYPDKNSLTVMIHGDYRTGNILFKKDDTGKVTGAKLIDWQLSGEGNPVLDLIFFYITSVPIRIFEKNDELIINTYLNKLNEVLTSVKSDRFYSRSEMDRDMLYYRYFYLRTLLYNYPSIIDAQTPGIPESTYLSNASGWIKYLESKGMI